MSEKEQNKPETVQQAAKAYSLKSKMMDVGVSIWEIDAFKAGVKWQIAQDDELMQQIRVAHKMIEEQGIFKEPPYRAFTESEVISIIEALRQRCAEEIKLGDTVLQLKNKINRVEYRDLIPPLTKQ